jgi:hypothetical protein
MTKSKGWKGESKRHSLSRQGVRTSKLEVFGGIKVVPLLEFGELKGNANFSGIIYHGKAVRLTSGDYLFISDENLEGIHADPRNPEEYISTVDVIEPDNFQTESRTPSGEFTRAIKKVMYNG